MKQPSVFQERIVALRLVVGKAFFVLACFLSLVLASPTRAAGVNGKIVFASDRTNRHYNIYIMNADGTGQTQLTNTTVGYNFSPVLSPDGSKIVFESNRTGVYQVYIVNADGSNQICLSNNGVGEGSPIFTPDGKILFSSIRDGQTSADFYTMNIDGSNVQRLTINSGGGGPRFNADGSKIAFSSNRNGNTDIYVMNADGTNQKQLTTSSSVDMNPSFSPDGSKIAFTTSRAGYFQIYTMNADGTNQVNLTNRQTTSVDYQPKYSQDGSKILFASTLTNNQFDLYTMNPDGSGITRLTTSAYDDQDPDWGAVFVRALNTTSISASEGSASSPGSATFTVTLSPSSTQSVSVHYATANGTATAGSDYVAQSGTLTFSPGQTSKTVVVPFIGDNVIENPETFYLNLSQPSGATLDVTQVTGTIMNDDGASVSEKIVFYSNRDGNPEIYIMNADGTNQTRLTNNSFKDYWPVFSPNGNKIAFESDRTGNFEIYVMNVDGSEQTRLTYSTGDDIHAAFSPDGTKILFSSARDGNAEIYVMNADGSNPVRLTNNTTADYTPRFSPDGQKIAFSSKRDGDEEIFIMDANGNNQTQLTFNTRIDTHPIFSPDSAKIVYGSSVSGYFQTFIMNVDGSSNTNLTNRQTTSVEYEPRYSPDKTKFVFASSRDGNYFEIYTMNVDGSNPIRLTSNTADDQNPDWAVVSSNSLNATNTVATEGSAASPGTAVFTVTLGAASSQAVTVNYATADDTATAGSDYLSTSGTLTFAPGETTKDISIPLIGDSVAESDEAFNMVFSQPSGATLSTTQVACLIFNDDAVVPTLSIANAANVNEGDSNYAGQSTFIVTLSPAVTQDVTVHYATANGTATAGSDYVAQSGTLTFAAGETTKTIVVPFVGDEVQEADEKFTVTLSQAANATLGTVQGSAVIVNDDAGPLPLVNINDVTVTEGNLGSTSATFTITLSAASTQTVTLDYATSGGTAITGTDFTAASGSLSFTPGVTSRTITVAVRGDTLDELNENFTLNVSNVVNGILNDGEGQGTITDDDATPFVSIDDAWVFEGNSGSVNATFTVTLSAASGQTVSISAIPTNGTAKAPGDFTATGVRLTFAPGEKSKTVTVPVMGDVINEADENYYVLLSSPTNGTISKGRGVGTIYDDDAIPSISIEGVNIGEGNSGQRVAAFRLKLSAPSGKVVKVNYSTSGGSATAGNDYVAVAPTAVSFTVGSLYAYARVLINGDLLNELDESFTVSLADATNANIASSQATGIILNDDRTPSLTVGDVLINEGNSGTSTATITVNLSAPSGQAVAVNYATADGVARSNSDYVATNGTLRFAAGETTKTFTVTINGDAVVEGDEPLYILLSGAVNSTVGRARASVTIVNDDASG